MLDLRNPLLPAQPETISTGDHLGSRTGTRGRLAIELHLVACLGLGMARPSPSQLLHSLDTWSNQLALSLAAGTETPADCSLLLFPVPSLSCCALGSFGRAFCSSDLFTSKVNSRCSGGICSEGFASSSSGESQQKSKLGFGRFDGTVQLASCAHLSLPGVTDVCWTLWEWDFITVISLFLR